MRMLRSLLGEQPFLNGMKEYLKRHLYSNVESYDLWEVLSTVSDSLNILKSLNTTFASYAYIYFLHSLR